MSSPPLDNLNVAGLEDMPTPAQVKTDVPLQAVGARTVADGRATIQRILAREDPRLFVVIGPCSIHDPDAALEYASRLRELAHRVRDTLFLVMRVYPEFMVLLPSTWLAVWLVWGQIGPGYRGQPKPPLFPVGDE